MRDPMSTCPHGVLVYHHEQRESECVLCQTEAQDQRIAALEAENTRLADQAVAANKRFTIAERERDRLAQRVEELTQQVAFFEETESLDSLRAETAEATVKSLAGYHYQKG